MSSWAIVVVVAISVWGLVQLIRARHGHSRHRGPHRDNSAVQQDTATQRELEELRERVKVLEQITVDGREAKTIADEIERLRDK